MDGILLKEILDSNYADELLGTIRSGGNIEEFLQNLEVAQRQDFLKEDKSIVSDREQIAQNEGMVSEIEAQIAQLEQEKSLAIEINKRINEIKATYPKSKQAELDTYLEGIAFEGKGNKEILTSKPKGIIDRIRYGKSIDAGNKKLEELLIFCGEHEISELSKESYIVKNAISGYPIEEKITKIDKDILSKQEYITLYADRIETSKKQIQQRINLYDSSDSENNSFAYRRKIQRQNIQRFAEDYQEILKQPNVLSKEEMLSSGLNEKYIEQQIMESKFPEKNLRSIRRSYEKLDRPTAPMVAFDRAATKSNGELYTTKIADDILEKLQQKGLDVVAETDPRAIDPNVFVVDKKARAVYAPFLSPDEALKANIAMIDTIYECGGEAARSSPRTRETFAIATHKNLSGQDISQRVEKLDLETVSGHYSKENFDRVMSDFSLEFENKINFQTLSQLMEKIKTDNPEKHAVLVKDVQNKAQPLISNQMWSEETANNFSKEFFQSHREDMMKYVKEFYQDTMVQEAFELGIDPHLPNKENLSLMDENKPITSVFHGGQNGGLPYSILCADKRMAHVYGATTLASDDLSETASQIAHGPFTGGSLGYAFGQSSHDKKVYGTKNKFGFVYEYEAFGDKQEIVFLETLGGTEVVPFKDGKYHLSDLSDIRDETAILPHQNKLKKIYIAAQKGTKEGLLTRVLPLELGEDGLIKDKRWRDFVDLHNPVDDSLEGFMVDRQNNMIADYDKCGKEKMMDRHLSIKNAKETSAAYDKIKELSGRTEAKPSYVSETEEKTIVSQNQMEQTPANTAQTQTPAESQEKVANMSEKEKGKALHNLRMGLNSISVNKTENGIIAERPLTNTSQQPSILQIKMANIGNEM